MVDEVVTVYKNGLCHCSVCTNVEDLERFVFLVNLRHSTGISSAWKISKDKTFATGEPNPCPCNINPKEFKHYLMDC